jgi:Arc/MetJ-type ribon-helix-helix transcriptional regulator
MHVSLRPETQRYIDEQLQTGRFPSLEAMIEAAVAELREVDDSLDADTISAINEAEAQADRGEGMELDAFRKHISARFRV